MPVLVRYSLKVFRPVLAGLCLLFSNTLVAQYTKPEKTENGQGTTKMAGVRSNLFSTKSEGLVLAELGSTPWLTSVVNTEKRNPLSASIQKIKKDKTARKSKKHRLRLTNSSQVHQQHNLISQPTSKATFLTVVLLPIIHWPFPLAGTSFR